MSLSKNEIAGCVRIAPVADMFRSGELVWDYFLEADLWKTARPFVIRNPLVSHDKPPRICFVRCLGRRRIARDEDLFSRDNGS